MREFSYPDCAAESNVSSAASQEQRRQEERRREEASTGSLREELERGIARLQYEIRAGSGISGGRRAIPLFVALFVAASLEMWAVAEIMGWSLWLPASVGPLMLLGLPVELWRHHRRVTRDLRPRLQSLQALRAKLKNPTETPGRDRSR
jgi:hypothetical protein